MSGDIQQGTDEWRLARCGWVGASRITDVMAKGQGKTRAAYMAQLACERLTGVPTEGFTSAAMERGTEMEPRARASYIMETGRDVAEVGFIPHPTIPMSGASPDGLVGEDGLWEGKCPLPHNHLAYLMADKAPAAYLRQMDWQMACTGREWVDFQSFCPDFGDGLELFIVRYERDQERIEEAEEAVTTFLYELDALVAKLRERRGF